jgi:thioredoxin-related protein
MALIVSCSLFFTSENEIETLAIGEHAPLVDNKMNSTLGQKLSLLDMKKENGLLVIFSCNTCPFVVGGGKFEGWEKDYNTISEMVKANNIGMVLVNSNEAKRKAGDSMKDMQARAKDQGYVMNYVLDKNHKLADAFGARTTPHVFLFDSTMTLIYTGSIDNTWNPAETEKKTYLENAVLEYISKQPLSTPTTAPKGCSIKRKS